MRRCRERMERPAERVRVAVHCLPQALFSGLALAHFQQAYAKIDLHHRIVRPRRQGAAIGLGGRGIFAIQHHDACKLGEKIETARRRRKRGSQCGACLASIVAAMLEPPQIQLQFDHAGCQRQAAFQHRDRLARLPAFREQAGKLAKRRGKAGRRAVVWRN